MPWGLRTIVLLVYLSLSVMPSAGDEVDFNRDIRPILSENCLVCHGPDAAARKAGLQLDTEAGARKDLGGYAAVSPGNLEASRLWRRVTVPDEEERMPPAKSGSRLDDRQLTLLRRWIEQGGRYARHWAYAKPSRPAIPEVSRPEWVRNPIDAFVLAALERQGWEPSPPADRSALARRVALDLTGLPPSLTEAEAFVSDSEPWAYERYVDSLLNRSEFGEHWARVWLDLARYADSAGYADDPPRTIWAYRDYVIRALNDNLPFDQFTLEQLAGDLLSEPTESQLIATAFHRNTMTNNEGGTNDEQFRNEAVVDRVNTTMQVWMGTTMACAQCHDHKYDPITQKEYFEFLAFFNNTEDADLRDERPVISLFTETQKRQKQEWLREIESIERQLASPDPKLTADRTAWQRRMRQPPQWKTVQVRSLSEQAGASSGAGNDQPDQEVHRVRFGVDRQPVRAVRVELKAQESDVALAGVAGSFEPEEGRAIEARFVRIELPGKDKILSLAEVEVWRDETNVARNGAATQSSVAYDGAASRAVDGNRDGDYNLNSTTHTAQSDDPWWELKLEKSGSVDRIEIWNRTDGGPAIGRRLAGFRIELLAEDRTVVWSSSPGEVPEPQFALAVESARALKFSEAFAGDASSVRKLESFLEPGNEKDRGWKVKGGTGQSHFLILVLTEPLTGAAGEAELALQPADGSAGLPVDSFSLAGTADESLVEYLRLPPEIRELLASDPASLSREQRQSLAAYHRSISTALDPLRDRLKQLRERVDQQKPYTTVPVLRELAADRRRDTRIQIRGNFLNQTDSVTEGTPSVFPSLPAGAPKDRLTLAKWLVSEENPLTSRVIVNRHWEQLFGTGIVTTSEEFGSQGSMPSHPSLLDWMAVEFMESGWDLKKLLRQIVTSATYRQTSRLTPVLLEADPYNRYFTRGPRVRLSAEMVRDQALVLGGLLSGRLYGQPARPPQPELGISAAFGSRIDWNTSQGSNRYRRAIYTQWRRSNPYPSMVAFDAPNREVCTVRRPRSNTPLQALVTLNDPVYVEAAQGLARRIAGQEGTPAEKIAWAFRLALVRPPTELERERLTQLFAAVRQEYERNPEPARAMATVPLGEPEPGADLPELAAWTVVGNVLLNLDEIFLKR